MRTGPSWELADFSTQLRYEDIPDEVIQQQKDHLLDGLGNGLYGATSDLGRMVLKVVDALPTQGDSTVWGVGRKVNAAQAAFANGTFANVSEMEDGHHRTKFKPNTCLMPAGVAVAEQVGAGGCDLLAALIAGLEVSLRVSEATHVGKEGYARGWLATSSIGPIGASMVTGRLIGLSLAQMVEALALAANQPSGIWSTGLTMAKRVAIGRAAENGILAAFMAAEGVTGGDTAFDGEWGTIGQIISPVYEPELLTKDLGLVWRTMTVGFKTYPTKGSTHSPIDALLEILQREPDLDADEIEQIRVRVTTGVASNRALRTFPPRDFWEAQNSLPYILAVTAIDRACGLDQFSEDRVHDERILTLASKVSVEGCDEADRMPPQAKTAIVDVHRSGGRVSSSRVDYCRGEPENPLSAAQIEGKFRAVAKAVLDEAAMAAVVEQVAGLEQLADVRTLTRHLAPAVVSRGSSGLAEPEATPPGGSALPPSFMELSAPDVRRVAEQTEVALVAVTQTAQTGPHLPVGSRYYIGEEIGRRVVRRLAADGYTAVLGAVLPFGHSEFNATFPGCIQLEPETLAQIIVEVSRCLHREGFKRVVLMSNAGGNQPSIKLAVHRLAQVPDLRVFFMDLQMVRPLALRGVLEGARPRSDNHGGEWETSCMLAIAPHLVDMSRAGCSYPDEADERNHLPFEGIGQHDRQLALGVQHNDGWTSPTGIIGDSTRGTAEKGHRILDNFADLVAGHIRKWVFDLPREAAQYGVDRAGWPKDTAREPRR